MSSSVKNLFRRIEALEDRFRKATPHHRNLLVEMSITAMVAAWTPKEVELVLSAAERLRLTQLPEDLRRRWVRSLNNISQQRCGRAFGDLLAYLPIETKHGCQSESSK